VVAAQVAELRLEERFCGPPASANGGYACGAIAELLGGEVEVALRRPLPLGRSLWLRVGDGGAVVHDGDELHQQAARQRLIRELRTRPARADRHRPRMWERLPFRRPRPAAA
jgi:hypothetical protein